MFRSFTAPYSHWWADIELIRVLLLAQAVSSTRAPCPPHRLAVTMSPEADQAIRDYKQSLVRGFHFGLQSEEADAKTLFPWFTNAWVSPPAVRFCALHLLVFTKSRLFCLWHLHCFGCRCATRTISSA